MDDRTESDEESYDEDAIANTYKHNDAEPGFSIHDEREKFVCGLWVMCMIWLLSVVICCT